MKILLMTSNTREHINLKENLFVTAPLGLLYLAQILENKGHKVKIIDTYARNLSAEHLLGIIHNFSPEVILSSLYTLDLDVNYRILKTIKETFPHIEIILGGHHATIMTDKTMQEFYFVNYIVRGEGELTLPELIDVLEKGKLEDIKNVLGISYREKPKRFDKSSLVSNATDKIIHNPDRPAIKDLDTIPIPSTKFVNLKNYYSKLNRRNPLGVIITSRGCPYKCTFCSRLNEDFRKYRVRSAGNVLEEIRELYAAGAKSLDIYDETFTVYKKRCVDILGQMKKEGIDMDIRIRTRVNVVDKSLLEFFSKHNVKIVCYGVESGNQEVLNLNNKMITLSLVEKAFKMTHKLGMETSAFFLIGLPGDTPKTINQTINFAKKLDSTYPSFGYLFPFPKTEVYENAHKYGELVGEWSAFKPQPYLKLPWMKGKEDLYKWVAIAFSRNIRTPSFVIKALKRCILTKNWNNLSYMARNALKDFNDIKGLRTDDKVRSDWIE